MNGAEIVFAYVANDEHGDGLDHHPSLLERLPRWRLLLAIPKHLTDAADRFRRVAQRFTGLPLRADVWTSSSGTAGYTKPSNAATTWARPRRPSPIGPRDARLDRVGSSAPAAAGGRTVIWS